MNNALLCWLLEQEEVKVLERFYEDNSEITSLIIDRTVQSWNWECAESAIKTLGELLKINETIRHLSFLDDRFYSLPEFRSTPSHHQLILEALNFNKTLLYIDIISTSRGDELNFAVEALKINPNLKIIIHDSFGNQKEYMKPL